MSRKAVPRNLGEDTADDGALAPSIPGAKSTSSKNGIAAPDIEAAPPMKDPPPATFRASAPSLMEHDDEAMEEPKANDNATSPSTQDAPVLMDENYETIPQEPNVERVTTRSSSLEEEDAKLKESATGVARLPQETSSVENDKTAMKNDEAARMTMGLTSEEALQPGAMRVGGGRSNDDTPDKTELKNREVGLLIGVDDDDLRQPGAVRVTTAAPSEHDSKRFQLEINADVEAPDEGPSPVAVSALPPAVGDTVTAYKVDEPKLVHAESIEDNRKRHIRRMALCGVAIVAVIVGVVVPVVLVTGDSDSGDEESFVFTTIVTDLCSPRHLKVHEDTLFVAQAGVGPWPIPEDPPNSEVCLTSTLFGDTSICYGDTGRVSSYDLDGASQGDVLTGLFSARNVLGRGTSEVYGTGAVDFDDDGNMFTVVGLGYINATELNLRNPDLVFGSVLKGDEAVATPWVPLYEFNYNMVPQPESNLFHLCIHDGVTYVVDAGADSLYTYRSVELAGTMEPDSAIRLPRVDNVPAVPANPRGGPCNDITPPRGPWFCGQYQDDAGNWLYSVNPVPTAVRINPNDPTRLWVSYLSGAIWNAPVSGIFFMDLVDGIPQEDTIQFVDGEFWSIVDFDFYNDDFFVLETIPGGSVPFAGRLSKLSFNPDTLEQTFEVVMENIVNPAGLKIHEDFIFISNNTFSMGLDDCNGEIVKASL